MESWVRLFSQFTQEALFFEAGLIALLLVGYTAFWILRKRRLGVAKPDLPASVVKSYLGELITDAHEVRAQLFGLLSEAGVQVPRSIEMGQAPIQVFTSPNVVTGPAGAIAVGAAASSVSSAKNSNAESITSSVSPAAEGNSERLEELERKLREQAEAMENLEAEKRRIEAELEAARNQTSEGSESAGPAGNDAELQAKIKELEEKLAEYSVIEDDLANLKRLQQENARLKSALEDGGGDAPAPEPEDSEQESSEAEVEASPQPEPEPVAEPESQFEDIADAVDASLQSPLDEALADSEPEVAAAPNTEEESAPTEPEPASEPEVEPKSAASPENVSKSDDDLLSEFEKMLNS